ncbi:MAG: hypothetical protein RBU37_09210 [Myxococcota bacterium]|nr:hypothetical protein [Myxococcota bacterium]
MSRRRGQHSQAREASDAFVTPELGLERLRVWLETQEGLHRLLASMPPSSTLADALARHRRLRQLGRRPSSCMSPDPLPTHEATPPNGSDGQSSPVSPREAALVERDQREGAQAEDRFSRIQENQPRQALQTEGSTDAARHSNPVDP